jgi:hypothetical protein
MDLSGWLSTQYIFYSWTVLTAECRQWVPKFFAILMQIFRNDSEHIFKGFIVVADKVIFYRKGQVTALLFKMFRSQWWWRRWTGKTDDREEWKVSETNWRTRLLAENMGVKQLTRMRTVNQKNSRTATVRKWTTHISNERQNVSN